MNNLTEVNSRKTLAGLPGVTEEGAARLASYAELLLKWNARINLIGRNSEDLVWTRHILDSAQVIKFIPNIKSLADFGSGAGFPGIVLAAIKDIEVILIESDARKCAFLQEVKARLKLTNVRIENKRIEEIKNIHPDAITARAFANVSDYLKLALPFQKTECLNILLKGSNVTSEIKLARKEFGFNIKSYPSITDKTGSILAITDIRKI